MSPTDDSRHDPAEPGDATRSGIDVDDILVPGPDTADEAAFLKARDDAEREAAALLRDALADHRGVDPDTASIEEAAGRLRAALAAGDPDATWMRRSAGLPEDLTWGPGGVPMHAEDLIWECVAATVAFEEDPGLSAEDQASIMSLDLADWLGALIGLVRTGPGSDADAPALVAHIETCPEIDGQPLDADDASLIEHAFELLLPAWQVAGIVDDDRRLTEVGAWMLPRAAAAAWRGSFDDETDGHDTIDLPDPRDLLGDGLGHLGDGSTDVDPYDENAEEDVLRTAVEGLNESFAAWCRDADVDADPGWVGTLLDLRITYLDDRPTRWTVGDLSELLTEIAPRKLSIPADEIRDGMNSLVAFLRYLDVQGELADGSADVDELVAWLERSQDVVVDTMDDRSRWGPAKALYSAAVADGVDPEDLDAVQAWMEDFNERPFAERQQVLGGAGPVADLPMRFLPPDDELASLVQATPIWRQLSGLVTYVGDKLPLTGAGNLKLSDARRLVAELDTGDVVDPVRRGRTDTVRSSTELPALTRIFDVAVAVGIVEVRGSNLYRVDDRIAEMNDEPVAIWRDVLGEWLVDRVLDRSADHAPWWLDELDGAIIPLLGGISGAEDGVELAAITEVLLQHPTLDHGPVPSDLPRAVMQDVHRLTSRLALVGLTELHEVRVTGRGDDRSVTGGYVTATPLATLLLHEIAGLPVHRVGELADRSARDLLDTIGEFPVEAADGEVAAWCAARPLAAALEEITEAARGDRPRTLAAFLVFEHLGAEVAGGAVERLSEDEVAGPLARAWLVSSGLRPFDDTGDGLDAMIGILATLVDVDGPEAVADALEQLGDADQQIDFIDAAWRSPLPEALTVLTAIGDRHPDKVVRKAGRKAAFKRCTAG